MNEIVDKIVSPREAALRGEGLRDRTEEGIFELMRRRSIPGARGFFYREDDRDLSSPLFDGCNIPDMIASFMKRNLVLAIPHLEFTPQGMAIAAAFLVRSGPPDVLQFMYSDAIKNNARAVHRWLESRTDLANDLSAELAPEFNPAYGADADQALVDAGAFIRPLRLLRGGNYCVTPQAAVLVSFAKDLEDELTKSERLVKIADDLYFPLHHDQIRSCFERAGEIFFDQIAPSAESEFPKLRKPLKRIRATEARYYSNPKNAATGRFLKRSSALFRRAFQAQSEDSVPIVVQFIEATAPYAEQAYERAAAERDREAVEEFSTGLMQLNSRWEDMIRIVDSVELRNMRPVVWAGIKSHTDLFWIRYERPGATYHVFIPRLRSNLPELMKGLLSLRAHRRWLIIALKEIIEANESFWAPLFQNPDFVRLYGRVLRKVYKDQIPWFLRILLILPIEAIRSRLFARAKARLKGEQARLGRLNSRTAQSRTEGRSRIPGSSARHKAVLAALQHAYYSQSTVPSVREIARAIHETDMQSFRGFLEQAGFRILATESFEDSVLFFPPDRDEANHKAKVRKMLARLTAGRPDSSRNDPLGKRAERLQIFLGPLSASADRQRKKKAGAPSI